MFKQPQGFNACFTSEMADRLAFYGLVSCIIILLTTTFGKSSDFSYKFYGELTGLGFITPVLGGILADRYYHRLPAVIIGLLFIVVGNICIIPMHFQLMLFGIACIVIGIGLMKPNDVSLVGMLYPPMSTAKEKGITIFYLGMNTGAILGPFILGLAFYFMHEYRIFFIFTVFILLMALLLFYKHYQSFKRISQPKQDLRKHVFSTPGFVCLALTLAGLTYFILRDIQVFNGVFGTMLIFVVLYLAYLLYQSQQQERMNITFVLILCFFSIAYFASSVQTSGALVIFSQLYAAKHLRMHLPVEWVASIEPLSIIFLGPLLIRFTAKRQGSRVNININIMLWKIAIALFVTGIAYFLFYMATCFLNFGFVFTMIVLGNILIGLGELLITTTLFSTISNFISEKHRGFFMSLYMLSIAISSYLGSLLTALVVGTDKGTSSLSNYPHLFLAFASITLGVGVFFMVVMPQLRNRMQLRELG